MKVLLLNKFHYHGGGAERVYFETKRLLEEHGHEVACFAMDHPHNELSSWSRYFVSYRDYNGKPGVRTAVRWALDIFYNREAARKLESLLKEFNPDVAHLHNIYHQLSPSVVHVLHKHSIPMVMTLHDYKLVSPAYNLSRNGRVYTRCLGGRYYRCVWDRCIKNSYAKSFVAAIEAYLYRWLRPYRHIHTFIAPSRFLQKTFVDNGFRGRLQYLPNPLQLPARLPSLPTEIVRPYILYAGRLSDEKGLGVLLDAWKRAGITTHELVIAGDGPLATVVTAMCVPGVRLLGKCPHSEVLTLMKHACAVVIPSTCYENGPYVAREATALTNNLICANVGGLQEIAITASQGVVYPPHSAENLANILKKAAKFSSEKKAVNNAHKGAPTFFWEEHYRQLLDIYQRAIENIV